MDVILYHPEAGHAPGWTADSYWPNKIMAGEGAGQGYDNTSNQQEMQILVRIVGADAAHNQAGITYHYLAFCDPGMRFCEAGALEATQGTSDVVHNLESETFTPDACFLMLEQPGASTTVGLHFKGLGHAASALSPANAAEITPGLKPSLGALTLSIRPGELGDRADRTSRVAARRQERRPGGAARRANPHLHRRRQCVAHHRALPLTGRRPLFVIVVPHNGASVCPRRGAHRHDLHAIPRDRGPERRHRLGRH